MPGRVRATIRPNAGRGTYVRVDPAALDRFLRDGGGPVFRELMRRGENVRLGAIRQVGKDTRRLERSIVKRWQQDDRGPFVLVATEGVSYSMHHHEGTPRTRPNRFLTDNLQLAAR